MVCISNKLPGGVDAAGWRTILSGSRQRPASSSVHACRNGMPIPGRQAGKRKRERPAMVEPHLGPNHAPTLNSL